MSKLNYLLIFVPVSVALRIFYPHSPWLFIAAGLAIIPLAGLIGQATEEMAIVLGPRLGGFLNATLGNTTEVVIAVFAIMAGRFEIVKASIAGSIIGNILFILGLGIFLGGFKRHTQDFDRTLVSVQSAMLVLAVIGLVIPAIFVQTNHGMNFLRIEELSLTVAVVLMLVYLASLVFTFFTHRTYFRTQFAEEPQIAKWSKTKSLSVLALTILAVALEAELLVGSIDSVLSGLHLTELFVGVIMIPIVSNSAEHSAAVIMAMRNKMDLALDISIGSSIQVALFVAPLLVFVSLALGHPMTYIFNLLELVAIGFSVAIVNLIAIDGKTNWLEGLQLIAVYLIIALAFFFGT